MHIDDVFTLPDGSPRPIPGVSPALVADLERRFPDRAPRLGESQEAVWFAAGAASVVRALRASMEGVEDPDTGLPLEPEPTPRTLTPFERSRRVARRAR